MPEYPQPGGEQRSQQKFLIFDNFEKMNTQAARTGLPNKQLAWLENLQPLSENKLQVVPAAAMAAFASIPENINLGFYAFLNGNDYAILFTTAGSAWFINFTTNAVGQIAADGTFSLAPDCTVWQGSVLLINDIKSGYCAWNTFCLALPGCMSPNMLPDPGGSGYGSPVNVTFFDTTLGLVVPGALAIAIPTNGVITSIVLQNAGTPGFIQPGDNISASFAVTGSGATFTATMTKSSLTSVSISDNGWWPTGGGNPGVGTYALTISGGGGSGAAATATVSLSGSGFLFVSAVNVTAAGANYTSNPTIIWPAANPISPSYLTPTFSPNMANIAVSSVAVTAGGSGYAHSATLNLNFSSHGQVTAPVGTVTTNSSGVITGTPAISNGGAYAIGSTPHVWVAGGGSGADAACQGWPYVPAGTTLAVFQGRVWLGGGNLLQWTGTGANAGFPASGLPGPGYDDFQAADAAGSLQIVDADLVHSITALRALNNYLWIVGDQSVKQIGNISISATTPPITLFTILTLSSDQGSIWPKSCISFNRIFLFANPNGIFGVFGSTVQKISDDLDGIFKLGNFAVQPQGAVVDLNSKHTAVFLLRYNDPLAGLRTLLLMFDGKRWWLANQGNVLDTILTFPNPASDQNTLFGCLTGGGDLTQLFAAPNVPVPFKMITALSHEGNPVQSKRIVRAGFTADAAGAGTVNMTIDFDTGSVANAFAVTATSVLVGGANDANNAPVTGAGVYLGATITGTLANFILQNVILEYQETALWKVLGVVSSGPGGLAPYTTEDGFGFYTTEDGLALYTVEV